VSTGGGASLELLEGKVSLPCVSLPCPPLHISAAASLAAHLCLSLSAHLCLCARAQFVCKQSAAVHGGGCTRYHLVFSAQRWVLGCTRHDLTHQDMPTRRFDLTCADGVGYGMVQVLPGITALSDA
jgi:hypothetical protein